MTNTKEYISETKDVATFFHGYAADFDSIYGHTKKRSSWDKFLDKYFRVSMRLRYELVLKYTATNEIRTILDVGCGGGVYCEALLNAGKTVTGIDIAEGMLQLAEQKTAQYITEGKVNYIHSGYLEHPFSQQYDAAVLVGFFDYIKTPIDTFKKLEKEVTKELLMSFPKSGGFLGWQRKVRYKMRNCPLYYYSKTDLESLLGQMGWLNKAEIIDIERDFFVRVTL
ncbi:MAG: putative 3-demethylubiquinone-9 3-O-methyltransferase [Ferruginibacter sp.]|uniref:class I SAM-dependent methyltransferase n=1 Tax=Ferruginibacter sp. TaxID=1940288 RepID=UPI0026584ABC|nr:class I SAM-dependent methyltransferase [Ferruginibacter sp.]MDB5280513.1 putative 3-demethylubiquinone-9 3-O-methyltransferase [Ferruginibacter sp.]